MIRLALFALVALFFIANGLNGFSDIVSGRDVAWISLILLCTGVITTIISLLLLKEPGRAGLYSAVLTFFAVFSRLIFNNLKEAVPALRPSFFFFFLFLTLILVYVWIKKISDRPLKKFTRFFSATFVCLILFEFGNMLFGQKSAPFKLNREVQLAPWKQGLAKPNIYVLLFDEYEGNSGLRKLGFPNDELLNFLDSLDFTIAANPRSTYQSTIYSLPSLFRMDTLGFKGEIAELTTRSAIEANLILQNQNTFTNYLKENGYSLESYSLFSIADNQPFSKIPIGTTWLELQQLRMLPWWAKNDLLNAVPSNKVQKIMGTLNAKMVVYNDKGLEFLGNRITTVGSQPRFIFSHILIPHPPNLIDSNGKGRSLQKAMYEQNLTLPSFIPAYISQVKFANGLITRAISDILAKDPECAILLISDHGCRNCFPKQPEVFNIQWAIKLPGNKPHLSQDKLHLVNTFRILLNEVAGQNLPMVQTVSKY